MSKRRHTARGESASPAEPMPDLLSGIANRVRLEILMSLARAPKDVSSVAAELEFAIHTISHHLGVLSSHGLVEQERLKTRRVYRLSRSWTLAATDGVMHLRAAGSEGLEFELRFPAHGRVWWSPLVASGDPGLSGGVIG